MAFAWSNSCLLPNPRHVVPLIVRAVAIVGDLLVLGLCWAKTSPAWRASWKVDHFKPTISTIILHDGTLYFVALLILNIVTLTIDIVQSAQTGSTAFITVVDAITSNLISRFILDLRVDHVPTSFHLTHQISSVRFDNNMRSFAGNIGAPLVDSEDIDAREHYDDVDEQVQKREGNEEVI